MVSIWVALLFLAIGLLTGWTVAMVHANAQIEDWMVRYHSLRARVGVDKST